MTDWKSKIQQKMQEKEKGIVEVFRHLHMHPEMSFKEFETTAFIKKELEKLGIEIQDIGMETGVVGVLRGGQDGPCIALRADIDGLPVEELTDYEFKSKNPGRMHACGHDTHMGALLGAAKILADMREEIQGTVKFFFQPAEERNQGAKLMIAHGCMENPHVDMVFGMHNSPEIPVGSIVVKEGGLMAAVDRYYVTIHGKGGHGGVPHRNIDPVVGAAAFIQSVQTIASRMVNPMEPCVVSICSLHAGEGLTYNVTPQEVKMAGTCRSFDKETGALLEPAMRNILDHTMAAYRLAGELEYIYDQPAVINPKEVYPIAKEAVEGIGLKAVDAEPSTGGEDFTFFMQETPAFFYWLGVKGPNVEEIHPWHSPKFHADERSIAMGSGVYAASVFSAIDAILKQKGEEK